MRLYHYTCDHGARAIEKSMTLKTGAVHGLLWLTDLDVPVTRGLGLTSQILNCDRTAHRFIVEVPVDVERWVDVRRNYPTEYVRALESADGAMPMHWYVTTSKQLAVTS